MTARQTRSIESLMNLTGPIDRLSEVMRFAWEEFACNVPVSKHKGEAMRAAELYVQAVIAYEAVTGPDDEEGQHGD